MTDSENKPPDVPRPSESSLEPESAPAGKSYTWSVEEIQRLIHELRVHQIELEMQNQELRTAQIALEESREKYVDLYDAAPVAYFTLDDEGVIREANLNAVQLLGVQRNLLVGMPLARFVRGEDADLWHLHIRAVFDTGSRQTCEIGLRKTNGDAFYGRVESMAVQDSDGRFHRCKTIISDITERKLAQEELRQVEERFRRVFEQGPLGLAIVHLNYKFLAVNDAFCRMVGYSKEELSRLTFADITHPEDIPRDLGQAQQLLEGGLPVYRAEKRYIKKTGEILWIRLTASVIRDASGKALYLLAMMEDMTEHKQAEDLLIRTSRLEAVADLVKGVAHNFNNLLQVVMGTLELSLLDLEAGDLSDLKISMEHVLERSKASAELVKRLESFASVRAHIRPSETAVFDLSSVVRDAAEITEQWWLGTPNRQGIEASLSLDLADGCFIRGEDGELFEVVTNLMKNAAEALSGSGHIDVTTRVGGDQVILSVKDDGIGIPRHNVGKVFEPFWSAKGLARSGMGLAVTYGIVTRHAGTISVESEEGKGSIFTVRLPLSERPPEDIKQCRAVSPVDTRLTVLVIEDMEPVADFLEAALTRFGHTVRKALSGPKALEIFKEEHVDLVISDLGMPGMSGWEVGKTVKEICRQRGTSKPPFILLTGWGGQILDKEKIIDSGVDGTVEKPVVIDKLIKVIQEAAEKTRTNQNKS